MINWDHVLNFANVLVIPALGYIIVLERRITAMQVKIESLIEIVRARR